MGWVNLGEGIRSSSMPVKGGGDLVVEDTICCLPDLNWGKGWCTHKKNRSKLSAVQKAIIWVEIFGMLSAHHLDFGSSSYDVIQVPNRHVSNLRRLIFLFRAKQTGFSVV